MTSDRADSPARWQDPTSAPVVTPFSRAPKTHGSADGTGRTSFVPLVVAGVESSASDDSKESASEPVSVVLERLDETLRAVLNEVARVRELAEAGTPASHLSARLMSRLSERERIVVQRVIAGYRVPSIARELYVSQSTVRNHLSAAFKKLGVHSQAELLERARSGQ